MAEFATSTAIKRMLGIPSSVSTHDDAISDLLDVANQMVLDELNLTAGVTTVYHDYMDVDSNGQTSINTTRRPVLEVVALTIGGTKYASTEYKIDLPTGMIKLKPIYAFLPTGRDKVIITYKAGFATIPSDLIYAGNLIACSLFNQQAHVGFASERAGSYSYNLGNPTGSTIPAIANRILNKHRRVFARGAV